MPGIASERLPRAGRLRRYGTLALLLFGTARANAAMQDVKTVFLILMENRNWSTLVGNPSAPYINDTLLPMASHAEQYFNPDGLHPSLPNYIWLEAGSNLGIRGDASPRRHHLNTTAHLVTLLADAGISWTSYQEGICGCTCPLTSMNHYAPKHDPMVYFDDVTNTNDVNSAYCISHVRPFQELAANLQNGTVARYNFITPDLCDDMHNSCPPLHNGTRAGDDWLAQNIPVILDSPAYQDNGAIFITWDESQRRGAFPIGMIVLSPLARGHGYSNTIHYTHSSTLRSLQEIFGVTPLLNDAANATDLSDLFLP